MSDAWERLGRVFRAEGQRPWMRTHSQMPHAEVIEGGLIRVYFTCRDADNRSHIAWLTMDLEHPDRPPELAAEPLMSPGPIGRFDDMGIMTSWMLVEEGRRRFYTIGWNVKNRVPMHTSIGFASGPAGGEPSIDEAVAGPVLERNPRNPYYVSCPCVLRDGDGWRMWYMSGIDWGTKDGAPASRYITWHARSTDGITWTPDPEPCVDLEHAGELAIARACVVRDPALWRMWHCYRGEDFPYRIGYVESADGEAWTRRDDHLDLAPSGDGFDAEMTCYPYVFDHLGERWMLYCGDGFGQGGLGLARLKTGSRRMTGLRDAYVRDGFVVVPGFMPPAVLDGLCEDLVEVFHRRALSLGVDVRAEATHGGLSAVLRALFDCDQRAYLAAAKLAQHLMSVHRIGASDRMAAVLAELGLSLPSISTRPVIHFMCDRLKITGGYQKTPPHQDWRSVQGSLDGLTVWAPLFDVGLDDYPLEIVPGSHRAGLLPDVEDVPNYRIRDDLWRDADFVPLPMGRGDAVFFSGFLVHRTGATGGDLARVSFEYRFNNVAEPSFAARSYPNTYVYRPDMTLLDAAFPGPEDVAAIFPPMPAARTGTLG